MWQEQRICLHVSQLIRIVLRTIDFKLITIQSCANLDTSRNSMT